MIEPQPPIESPNVALVVESTDSAQILHVFGELDVYSADGFQSTAAAAVVPGKTFVVDLSECRYIDSTIISVLVRLRKSVGEHFTVVAADIGNVSRVLRLTHMSQCFPIVSAISPLSGVR